MIRKAAVAGSFYDSDPRRLKRAVQGCLEPETRTPALGVMVPHAGYLYSGGVAGSVYSRIVPAASYLIFGPNHTGYGTPASVMCEGAWETPLGVMEIDSALARALLQGSSLFREDSRAHLREHSIEVQLPFLQTLGEARFVPVTLMATDYGSCEEMGRAAAAAVQTGGGSVLIVASSDMTHFESRESAQSKDRLALDRIEALDPEGLYDTVRGRGISMCGYVPATVMLIAAKTLGARKARVVRYATSGEVTGDFDEVVGYAGVIVE